MNLATFFPRKHFQIEIRQVADFYRNYAILFIIPYFCKDDVVPVSARTALSVSAYIN